MADACRSGGLADGRGNACDYDVISNDGEVDAEDFRAFVNAYGNWLKIGLGKQKASVPYIDESTAEVKQSDLRRAIME